MIPGNMDPRRPEKVQRYKAPQANGNAPVEDLTPDYMNILGPDSATANAEATSEHVKGAESNAESTAEASTSTVNQEPMSALVQGNGTNVIPTSPQYGVAIISNNVNEQMLSDSITVVNDTVVETMAKSESDIKDMHSTPSRNDRFKVVKIASLEPFRRGRWKCMDYVDENPPTATTQSKTSQSQSNIQMGGNMYMQTQSLPQQHFQQMLVQGGYTNQPQFYQNMPSQMMQSQYFYPSQNVGSMQHIQVQPNNIQPQFINSNQYFPPNVVPHSAGYNYQNVQYVASNIIPNQSSAFVSTTQNVNPQLPPNFQQSQTYAGPPSGNQGNIQQPMVNGHAYPSQQNETPVGSSLPTQVAKNVILNANLPQNQSQMNQAIQQQQNIMQSNSLPHSQMNQYNPNTGGYQNVLATNTQPNINQGTPVASTGTPGGPIVSAVAHSVNQLSSTSAHQSQGNSTTTSASQPPTSVHFTHNFPTSHIQHPHQMQPQHYDPNFATNVYTNPQFVASVNSLPDNGEMQGENADSNADGENASGEDPNKMNPVVNAIDNKIEQAMDLVKSHLMYTVREEVEVLKEKIAELMERIQQLESENSHLKQQIPPKGSNNNNNCSDPPPPSQ